MSETRVSHEAEVLSPVVPFRDEAAVQRPKSCPRARYVRTRANGSKYSIFSALNERLVIPPCISPRNRSEQGQAIEADTGLLSADVVSGVRKSEEVDAGSLPVKTIPRRSCWSDGFQISASRVNSQLKRSKAIRKLLMRPRSQYWSPFRSLCYMQNAGHSPEGTRLTPPNTPHATNTLRAVVSDFPGNEARRVRTPSLDEGTAADTPRGFFSSFTPPATTLDGVPPSTMANVLTHKTTSSINDISEAVFLPRHVNAQSCVSITEEEEFRPAQGGAVTPKSKKDAIKTGEYTNLTQKGIGALPTVQPNSRSVHTRTASKEVGLKDLSSKETGARYIGRDIGSNDTSFQYVCEDITSKETGSKWIVSTDVVSGDLDPKDKNFKEAGANYIVYQDAAPNHSALSTVNESFLIPPGPGSKIHSEHGKKNAVVYGSAVQFSEDLDVGCGPARTKPLGFFWPNGFLKKASRLRSQKQRSKSIRRLLPRPRFQNRALHISGGTNRPTLLNTPHGTDSQSTNKPGGGARQYASNGRGHSRRQAEGFLLVNDASGEHAGQCFPQHIDFTSYTHKAESSVSAKQCFFPAT
ncbi:uncharacterized protein CPUR_08485 [Claviceps purpurea 20.1]|uniref:Uncharacterized protein n=1 Tax=Claviceps purpurea (strain 20.1) TaxID=1111077 RepID=M1VZ27_CLAP2|nr:uncharacterized protein CPUR_08485 [Claviceps purpurea 20.1]